MSSGLGLVIRQNKQGGGGVIPPGVLIDARNGLNDTVTADTAELGGPLIRDTDITGAAFKIGFTNASIGVGLTAAAANPANKFHVQQTITNPVDGTNAILGQGIYTPNVSMNQNFYGAAGMIILNLAGAIVGGPNSFNSTGLLGALVLSGNNALPSTRRLRAITGAVVMNGGVLANDIAAIECRSPEILLANTVTNLYGLYIDQQAVTGVTTAYGIFQASAQDINQFSGTILGAGGIRVNGNLALPVGGDALELLTSASIGLIQGYNRTGANYISLRLGGLLIDFHVNGFQAFTVTPQGNLSANYIHNNTLLPTGASPSFIGSGTYTPTLFNTTNVAASTPYLCQWIRVGNVVTVSGKVDIDPTAAAATLLGMSLPIPSAMTAEQNLAGTAATNTAVQDAIRILSDFTNDRASFSYTAISLANISYSFSFTYLIL